VPDKAIGPDNFAWVEKPLTNWDDPARWNRGQRNLNPMRYRGHDLRKNFGIELADYQRPFDEQGASAPSASSRRQKSEVTRQKG
jgi:hypothetical protein